MKTIIRVGGTHLGLERPEDVGELGRSCRYEHHRMLVECRYSGGERENIICGELDISLERRAVELYCALVGTKSQRIDSDHILLVLLRELQRVKPRIGFAIKLSQVKMNWSVDSDCCDCKFAHIND